MSPSRKYPKFAARINLKWFRSIPLLLLLLSSKLDAMAPFTCSKFKSKYIQLYIPKYSENTYLARSASCLSLGQTFCPLLLPAVLLPPSRLPPLKKFIYASMFNGSRKKSARFALNIKEIFRLFPFSFSRSLVLYSVTRTHTDTNITNICSCGRPFRRSVRSLYSIQICSIFFFYAPRSRR